MDRNPEIIAGQPAVRFRPEQNAQRFAPVDAPRLHGQVGQKGALPVRAESNRASTGTINLKPTQQSDLHEGILSDMRWKRHGNDQDMCWKWRFCKLFPNHWVLFRPGWNTFTQIDWPRRIHPGPH